MTDSRFTIALGANLDVSQVQEKYKLFEDALARASSFTVDLSSINRIDTAGIQLLLAFKKEVQFRSGNVTWTAPAQPFLDVASQLGLAHEFEGH
ncbi:STAS domain-containing protein [Simiduia agarivorans]|uniref:Stas domain, putative n=1 Tax=Simiduia agarivorans (strain DSM 21679 / JCM 13881 / BCRC 17597 / SA1) TaxID=1117647 RepID=K4KGJ2_SIMAS|nr:STAS domain-containing protein [Simiduia agarivorans]AFU97315.1 stas domain, putative [Simiduia agarivorans SA1 = DSM 21679]